MLILNKVYNGSKWTIETIKGAYNVLSRPNDPIPPSKLHPRMMARPWTVGEWVRLNSWRHLWMYMPTIRLYIFGALGTFVLMKTAFPAKPREAIKDAEKKLEEHHHEVEKHYGRQQKENDKKYFEKYDPLKKIRPNAAALVYGGGH